MFKSHITTTPFTSNAANAYFKNITERYRDMRGDSFLDDYSFLATLRALVGPRLKEDEHLYLRFTNSGYTANQIEGTGEVGAIRAVSPGEDVTDTLTIHSFLNYTPENNAAWMEVVKSSFCKVNHGWHQLEKVTELFRPIFYVLCFVNPEDKNTIIFANDMGIREMHALQAAIPGFIPWFFADSGINEEEKELLDSLFKYKTSHQYEDCLARMAEKYDFRADAIRNLLSGFEMRYEELSCNEIRDDIAHVLSYIDDYNQRIADLLRQKKDSEAKLLGLETKIAQSEGESEIMDYFLCNDKLVLESVDGCRLIFGVKDYITYFDEDMAKRVIDNESSYIYSPRGRMCNNIIPAEDMKKLATAIFIDETIRVRVCAAYDFRIDGNVRALGGFGYGAEYRYCTPNTHIDRYCCLGSYEVQINKLLANRDYIGAIEQCVASCKSLNFGDSTVMAEFMSRLYNISDYKVNIRCLELPDGRVVTPKEAIEYLKQEEVDNG